MFVFYIHIYIIYREIICKCKYMHISITGRQKDSVLICIYIYIHTHTQAGRQDSVLIYIIDI